MFHLRDLELSPVLNQPGWSQVGLHMLAQLCQQEHGILSWYDAGLTFFHARDSLTLSIVFIFSFGIFRYTTIAGQDDLL